MHSSSRRYFQDVPHSRLSHLRLTNNDNELLIKSRDAQEVLWIPGRAVMQAFSAAVSRGSTGSILDSFPHYDEAEAKLKALRVVDPAGRGGRDRTNRQQPGVRMLDRRARD